MSRSSFYLPKMSFDRQKPSLSDQPDYSHWMFRDCLVWLPIFQPNTFQDISAYRRPFRRAQPLNWPNDSFGRYLETTGGSSYAACDLTFFRHAYTVMCRCKPMRFTVDYDYFISWASTVTTGSQWVMQRTSENILEAAFRTTGSFVMSPFGNADDEWKHLAMTVNEDVTLLRTFRAGEAVGSAAVVDTNVPFQELNLGRFRSVSSNLNNPYNLHDIRVYNRELTADEIREIYRNPWAPWERSLWWSLGEAAPGDKVLAGTSTVQHNGTGDLTSIAAPVYDIDGTSTVQHDGTATLDLVQAGIQALSGTSTVEHDGIAVLSIVQPGVESLLGQSRVNHDGAADATIIAAPHALGGTSTVQHDGIATADITPATVYDIAATSTVQHDGIAVLSPLQPGVESLLGQSRVNHDGVATLLVDRILAGESVVQHDGSGTIEGATMPLPSGQYWRAPSTRAHWSIKTYARLNNQ